MINEEKQVCYNMQVYNDFVDFPFAMTNIEDFEFDKLLSHPNPEVRAFNFILITKCTTKGNTYEMTVHDFEENVEPIIIKTNREYSGGDIPEYIYDFTDILKVGPQNIDEYFNPETGEKIVI